MKTRRREGKTNSSSQRERGRERTERTDEGKRRQMMMMGNRRGRYSKMLKIYYQGREEKK